MSWVPVPFSFCRRRYRLAPGRIGMLRFLVEGYDGILFLRTIEASTAIVELSWSESCAVDADAILTGLGAELEMVPETDR
ncbi:MAG: DUF4911 domain-containing protein [Desulfuromonadales bacterium]|nr:DUF4911 domain-containing protein [Desulfuromonadales bacterium]